MILAAGRPSAVDPERAAQPPPATLQATREAPVPLAFRYRGVLCGPRGCLGTTILRLCRSGQVARLHVRIESLPGTRDALATLVAVSAGRAWDQRRLTRLASDPFQPERTGLGGSVRRRGTTGASRSAHDPTSAQSPRSRRPERSCAAKAGIPALIGRW